MEFWKFLFVPTILFLVIVAPLWITMHYRSVNRSLAESESRGQGSIEHMLETVDKLTDRIGTWSPSWMWITRNGAARS